MKRSGFKPKGWTPKPSRQYEGEGPKPRAIVHRKADTKARMVIPVPKEAPVRHEGYRRIVASLPCVCCGRVGHSQAAHANEGKGIGTKTDDRLCMPLCADGWWGEGCHSKFDQGKMFDKEGRRAIAKVWAEATRRKIFHLLGLWPADLERWPEEIG